MENEKHNKNDGPVHFIILQHGICGKTGDTNGIARALEHKFSQNSANKFVVLQPTINSVDGSNPFRFLVNTTYDGVVRGGERIATSIVDAVKDHLPCRLSVIGHSLGGLYLRVAIKILNVDGWFQNDKIEPVNFISLAAPHLGIRETRKWWAHVMAPLCPTGRDLLGMTSCLSDLCEPEYLLALSLFERRILYGNVLNDEAVQYHTSLLSVLPPSGRVLPGFPHVLEPLAGAGSPKASQLCTIFRRRGVSKEHYMFKALSSLQFDRYPVLFTGPGEPHVCIISHDPLDVELEGADVVAHLTTHFESQSPIILTTTVIADPQSTEIHKEKTAPPISVEC